MRLVLVSARRTIPKWHLVAWLSLLEDDLMIGLHFFQVGLKTALISLLLELLDCSVLTLRVYRSQLKFRAQDVLILPCILLLPESLTNLDRL